MQSTLNRNNNWLFLVWTLKLFALILIISFKSIIKYILLKIKRALHNN